VKTSKSPTVALVVALGLFIQAQAQVPKTYYAATNGSSANTGTWTNSPWTLAYALTNAGASNTIVLMDGGPYPIVSLDTPSLQCGLTIAAQHKWKAFINGQAGNHAFHVDYGVSNVVVDGIRIAYSYLDDFNLYSGATIQNCWISGAARPPGWTTNGATGQGIYVSIYAATSSIPIIQYNLIEGNGATIAAGIPQDHGIYDGCSNSIIRGNVIRGNLGFGIQAYSGVAGNIISGDWIYENLVYRNGDGNGGKNCIVIACNGENGVVAGTNYIFGNICFNNNLVPTILCYDGTCYLSNNIIGGGNGGGYSGNIDIVSGVGYADYNLVTNSFSGSGSVDGGHNVVTNGFGLVNSANGLFWPTANSPARGKAVNQPPTADFFGNVQNSVSDIGAFQFDATLTTDIRGLDPSPSYGANYWTEPVLKDLTNFATSVTINGGVASLANNGGSLMSSNVATGTWSFTNSDKVNWLCYIMGGTASGISQNDSAVEISGSTNLNATLILQPNEWLRITNTTAPRFTFKRF
jgi:hypothetical protein